MVLIVKGLGPPLPLSLKFDKVLASPVTSWSLRLCVKTLRFLKPVFKKDICVRKHSTRTHAGQASPVSSKITNKIQSFRCCLIRYWKLIKFQLKNMQDDSFAAEQNRKLQVQTSLVDKCGELYTVLLIYCNT